MLKLLKFLKWYDYLLIAGVFGLLGGQAWIDLLLPDYMGKIMGLISKGGTVAQIWGEGWQMLCFALASGCMFVIASYVISIICARLSTSIRRGEFSKVASFSLAEMNKFPVPSLITRTTNDVKQVQFSFMMLLRIAVSAPLTAIMAIIKISSKNMTLTGIVIGAVGVLIAAIITILIFALPKFKVIQTQYDSLTRVARENLQGMRVVKAYNAEKYQEKKFDKENTTITDTYFAVSKTMSFMDPVLGFIMSGLSLAIVWAGAFIVAKDPEFLTDLTTFTQYAVQILFSVLMLSMLMIMLPRAIVSAKRINEVLDTKVTVTDNEKTGGTPDFTAPIIEFRHVSFAYPGAEEKVLSDINIKVERGQTVAFIGATGCGKSTAINLIPRFFDATGGEVLLNGINVKDYKLDELHSYIGYVPQKAALLSGTVRKNVAYGRPAATDEEVIDALEAADAYEFVKEYEDGIEHSVSQGAKNFSGGQKQRLSIARALCKNPDVIIFDDSFSALDFKTDKAVRANLTKKTKGKTKIIVGQRVGTIMDADKIYVLEEGKIAGEGTHAELLNTCSLYREIAVSQLGEAAL